MRSLDHLRALAMLAGVFFHAALAHSPLLQPVFPTADSAQAPWLDALLWPLHLVRMPVFFVIAGWFAAQSLARRGMGDFLQARARRLLLPLVVLAPLFHGLMGWLVMQAALQAERPGPMLRWLRGAVESGQLGSLPPGTGHLWFLAYLWLFCVLLWVARSLLPQALKLRLRSLPLAAWVTGLPLVMAGAFASVSAPHPAPEGLLPQFWALVVYGGYFAFGLLAGPKLVQLAQTRWLAGLSAAGALACAVFMALLDGLREQAGWPLGLASAAASVWLSLALIGWSQRLLSRRLPLLQRFAEASYWIYLVHLPLLFTLQLAWLDWAQPVAVKLPLAVAITLLLGLISHEWLVRRTRPGRWLFASRSPAS
ncbi:acyltransferase family protein [Inhella sp.]|uniref:acyltransferase family protein n=1 Tax=Inhella sp. TaxID=1921806 RepID=UPI0035B4EA54